MATLGAERHGGWQGEEGIEPAGAFGSVDFGSAMLDHVNEIRRVSVRQHGAPPPPPPRGGGRTTFGGPPPAPRGPPAGG